MNRGENSWVYEKYSTDVVNCRRWLELAIESNDPRYLKYLPERIYETVSRIVDYKTKRATVGQIDSYFDN